MKIFSMPIHALFLGSLLALGGLSLPFYKQITRHINVFSESSSFMVEFGEKAAPGHINKLVKGYLRALKVPFWWLTQVKKTTAGSCSTHWHVWINDETKWGPVEFVAAHEAAHVAQGHFIDRLETEMTIDDMREQEKEADLIATELLFKRGKVDIVIYRLAQLIAAQRYVEQHKMPEDVNDEHPNYPQIIEYTKKFLEDNHVDYQEKLEKYLKVVKF